MREGKAARTKRASHVLKFFVGISDMQLGRWGFEGYTTSGFKESDSEEEDDIEEDEGEGMSQATAKDVMEEEDEEPEGPELEEEKRKEQGIFAPEFKIHPEVPSVHLESDDGILLRIEDRPQVRIFPF